MIQNMQMLKEIGWFEISIVIVLIFTIANQTFDLVSGFCKRFGITTARSVERETNSETLRTLVTQVATMKKQREEDVKQSILHDDLLKVSITKIDERLINMEQQQKDTKVEELKDRLTQLYRQYKLVAEETGVKQWNELEADAFWGLYQRYTSYGGNHYVLDVIEPYMREFIVVSIINNTKLGG